MLKVYLSGEIHTNWREEIIEKWDNGNVKQINTYLYHRGQKFFIKKNLYTSSGNRDYEITYYQNRNRESITNFKEGPDIQEICLHLC